MQASGQEFPLRCQRDAVARAGDKANAKMLLQPSDLLADSGMGHIQSLSGASQIAVLGCGGEGSERG